MASINDLVKLFSAISGEDTVSARSLARTIAAKEGSRGNRKAELLLKSALASPETKTVPIEPLATDNIAARALSRVQPILGLDQVYLSDSTREELFSIVEEFVSRWALREAKIPNRNRLLFVGPPGCGKSVTAKALALYLDLPIYILRFDTLIGSYLGQTAQNLRAIFDFIERTTCVVLIDEIDAISTARGAARDIGELDRIVISLMQQLELATPAGLLVCTSNLPDSIDRAVMRRFDSVIKFPAPTPKLMRSYCLNLFKRFDIEESKSALIKATKMHSYAEVEKIVISLARQKILDQAKKGQG